MTQPTRMDPGTRSDLITQIDAIKFPDSESVTNVDDITAIENALNRLNMRFKQSVPAWRRK